MRFMEWNPAIGQKFSKINECYRNEDYSGIINEYFQILEYVLGDLFKNIIYEADDGEEIQREVKEIYSRRNSKNEIVQKRTFLDLQVGEKIGVFNRLSLFGKLNKSPHDLAIINSLFVEIDKHRILRNRGVEHSSSAPTGLVREQVEIDRICAEEVALSFDKFFKILGVASTSTFFRVVDNLPDPECIEFIGRKRKKNEILDYLSNPKVKVVALTGFGGYGKTELMKQVAIELKENSNQFQALIWVSFKRDRYVVEADCIDEIKNADEFRSLEDIYDLILEKIGQEVKQDILSYSLTQKTNKVERMLSEKSVLLLIDNYETVKDDRQIKNFVERPDKLPSNVKLLVSSRIHIDPFMIKNVELGPFSKQETIQYLRSGFERVNVQFNLSEKFIDQIEKKSFGHPFSLQSILRWILDGKIHEHNIDRMIINSLNSTRIGEFCFEKDYRSLDDVPRHLLCIACAKPDITKEELRLMAGAILKLNYDSFSQELVRLARYNFILHPTDPSKIFVPDLVKFYVRKELDREHIRKENNSYILLSNLIGAAWKQLKTETPDLISWSKLQKNIDCVCSYTNRQPDAVYLKLLDELQSFEETKNSDADFWYSRARLNYMLFRFSVAENDLLTARNINPLEPSYYLFSAKIFSERNLLNPAIDVLKEGLSQAVIPAPSQLDLLSELCGFYSDFWVFKGIFDEYYEYPSPPGTLRLRFKIRLLKTLNYTIFRSIKTVEADFQNDSPKVWSSLKKLLEYLRLIDAFISLYDKDLYDDLKKKLLENEIKSLREISKKFKALGYYEDSSLIRQEADKLQDKYGLQYGLFKNA